MLTDLVCPACLGTLDENKISNADSTCRCRACSRDYDVLHGIPLLVLKDERWATTSAEADAEHSMIHRQPESEHLRRNHFIDRISREALAGLDLPKSAHILDVGGASGTAAFLFRDIAARLVVTDIDCRLLLAAQVFLEGRTEHRLVASAMEWLPFPDNSFDLVFCRQALHHSPDPATALREMFRVARPGATVMVIAEPCVSAIHHLASPLVHAWRRSRNAGARQILNQLADNNFHFGWRDYDRAFAALTTDYVIQRAHCAPAAVARGERIVFVEDHRVALPLVRLLDRLMPGGRGYWGSVHIRATKVSPVPRTAPPSAHAPVRSADVNIPPLPPEERAYLQQLLPKLCPEVNGR